MSGHASVLGVETHERFHRIDGAVEICWARPVSVETDRIIASIEMHLRAELEARAGLKLKFLPDCLSALDPFLPIGFAFYDDPETREGIRSEIRQSTDAPFGHPKTFWRGIWTNRHLIDTNLTSRFSEVNAQLVEQAAPLSARGKDNLLISIALHEILHALGFVHEQNHRDSLCLEGEERYRERSHTLLTPYDPRSIMNYCYTHSFDFESGPMTLSDLDLVGIKSVYGP